VKAYKDTAQSQITPYSTGFMHIPPPEYITVWNDFPTYGKKYDSVACPLVNTNIINEMLSANNMQLLLVGHNHNNDYGGDFTDSSGKSLHLAFGRKTGYGGYPICCFRKNGGRLIKYSIDNGKISFKH
jgi:hypothetical protein